MKNNNPYIAGIADCWYSGVEADLWVEYKYLTISRPNIIVIPKLSEQQKEWIEQRRLEGREVWVVIGYKLGVVLYKKWNDMVQGLSPDEFIKRTMTRKELADEINSYCGPSRRIYDREQELQRCN